jgi:excisionase family DNA binding protein
MTPTDIQPLLTTRQVCEWLRVDRKTLRRLINAKLITATKILTEWRFTREDVEEFLNRGKHRATTARRAA